MRRVLKSLATPFTQTVGLARWMLVVGVVITVAFLVMAVLAPVLAPYDFAQSAADGVRFPKVGPPSGAHPFGTDRLFFDVLSRMIWGARTAIEVVVLSILVCVVVGVPLGLVSGYYGGWLARILVLVMDALFAFPSFLLAIVFSFLLTGLFGGSVLAVALSLSVVYVPQYFKVVRNTTVSAKEATYVEAARAVGAGDGVIMRRYLFSNVVQSVPVIGTLNAADAILTLAGLGFLGLGIQSTEAAEWGHDLNRALADAGGGVWWTGLYPGLAIVLLVSGLTLVGEGLNETLNPTLRRRRLLPVVMPPRETERPDPTGEVAAAASTGPAPVVSARDMRVWYGTTKGPVRAVDGVTFDLRPGETLGVVGESGCGKSTLGRGLMGLLPEGAKRDGEVLLKGTDILTLKPKERYELRGREMGMIFQEPLTRLNPLMRVSQHFEETLHQHEPDLSKAEVRERALDVLRIMGIPPTRYRAFPPEFSGGMRQRLMIALTLVLRPAFVVADEPTTALDVLVEAQISRILHDLRREYDTAFLLITHNLGIVAEACDRVAVMYAGKIVEIGDAREVFTNPQHSYTRELLRSTISLKTTGLNFIEGAPPDLVAPPSGCYFHPRCPDAMAVCASTTPPERTLPTGTRVACWAADQRAGLVTLDDAEATPLVREELSVADEA
ncbi:hypothetical protein BH11ACT8_BH11ACT8_03110 [soil metagenome]